MITGVTTRTKNTMFDFATFEAEVEFLANERNHLVLEMFIDELLAETEPPPSHYQSCSYARHIESYVKAKSLYNRIRYSEFVEPEQAQRIQVLFKKHRKKMYENPCKTCSKCQSRRKKWPN